MDRKVVVLTLFAAFCPPASGQVTVDASVTVLIGSREPVALRKAAADLANDLEKVFGKRVREAAEPSQAGPVVICVALEENLPAGVTRPGTRETLLIQPVNQPWPGVRQAVVLTGSDLRGAIYAVYEFSHRHLGVDPFYWWTDNAPPRRARVVIPAAKLQDGPPSFRYRGWFINDEDLLTGWKPGTKDGTGISLEVWDRIYEALLRLKGNMMTPGTFLFPDEPQVKAARDRGIVITQHHIEVVGLNTYRWPEDQPYSIFGRPDLLARAWKNAVNEYLPDQEVIWTVGYRGRHDRPFWSDDKEAPKDEAGRAKAIRGAIDTQMEIVRSGRRDPYFLMNAWSEAVPLVRSGALRIPEGVHLVWPDNGHGIIRDENSIAAGQGVYYHTAMYNSRANQLTEMVPLERIQRELGRAAKAGATEYLLINTSDLRPVTLTTRAVMELAWNAPAWQNTGAPAEYLARWSREEFGASAAEAASAYYRAYFAAPGRYGAAEQETLADNAYHYFARDLLVRFIQGKATPSAALYERVAREAGPRWAAVQVAAEKAAKTTPAARREFAQSHILTQAGIQLHSNRMLMHVAEAVSAPAGGRAPLLKEAATDARRALESMKAAEYGKWKGFYDGDLMVNVRYSIALINAAIAKIETGKPTDGLKIAIQPEDPYVTLKAYQGTRRVTLHE
jgi:hypothetical protein